MDLFLPFFYRSPRGGKRISQKMLSLSFSVYFAKTITDASEWARAAAIIIFRGNGLSGEEKAFQGGCLSTYLSIHQFSVWLIWGAMLSDAFATLFFASVERAPLQLHNGLLICLRAMLEGETETLRILSDRSGLNTLTSSSWNIYERYL